MARIVVAETEPVLSTQLRGLTRRFGDDVLHTAHASEAFDISISGKRADLVIVDESLGTEALEQMDALLRTKATPVIWVAQPGSVDDCAALYARGVSYHVVKPYHHRELLSCVHAALRHQQRIVSLGGGAGLYNLLLGLKTLPGAHLTSVVSVSDDGGSSGRIRDAFGTLPPGDIRRSLVALSAAPMLMKRLMGHRFSRGDGLVDHNLGNLLLTAMSEITGSDAEGIRAMGDILNIQGIVLPVSTSVNELCAELEDGTVVRGEHNIDVPTGRDPNLRIVKLWQEPPIEANPNAISAILAADLVTIGPGDLFTSVIANLNVGGISTALQRTKGRVVYICNLMTKPGETMGLSASDHIEAVSRTLGEGCIDDVIVSRTAVSDEARERYRELGQELVEIEPALGAASDSMRVWEADVGSAEELVRHDPDKLAYLLADMLALAE